MANLFLKIRSEFSGFAGKDYELFWSTGVPEYWSVGKNESLDFNLNYSFHCSIAPPLHHSSRLPQEGKEHSNLLRRLPEDGSFGPGFFTLGGLQ